MPGRFSRDVICTSFSIPSHVHSVLQWVVKCPYMLAKGLQPIGREWTKGRLVHQEVMMRSAYREPPTKKRNDFIKRLCTTSTLHLPPRLYRRQTRPWRNRYSFEN